ncbi:Oidioi.mRNA.OKI2018_I69.chr2.g6591.t1.cds [Oikopleura dioica]|uniref:Oidioi.mRNA.OKI2018_I69.chr2.g6591.t1.cds n=1 Tax=Oikopleura dioica TaxID=34765 RepID=A0ABN7T3I8_OIKDI|nr:Oidioi.mRNA.OKI2018_I69.chr2.g6591.t1.cds [Oikopleura dioica]
MQTEQAMNLSLPPDVVTTMTELRENPFAERILEVFSEDSSGHITFNNFVDMFNVFSEHAPRDLKAFYAFKIYDMDNDGYISMDDLYNTLRCLTREELTKEEINLVVQKVLEESEMDDDCQISFMEFEHVISRAPDFLNTFHIRI